MKFFSQATVETARKPYFILVYGVDGVGKTTFACGGEKPIVLGKEDGLGKLAGIVPRLPTPKTFQEAIDMIQEAHHAFESHGKKTLVIDSLDWLEPVLWNDICQEHKKAHIDDFGYAKGYEYALPHWQKFIDALLLLRQKMNVVLIAHALVKTFQDPTQPAGYDRYLLKLHHKAASLLREAVDAVLFCNFQTHLKKDATQKTRAFGDGARLMYTERRPGFDAKNRLGLPFELPLDWGAFHDAAKLRTGETAETLIASIKEMMSEIKDNSIVARIEERLIEFGSDQEKLIKLKNKVMEAL